jgi:hypothetical protein
MLISTTAGAVGGSAAQRNHELSTEVRRLNISVTPGQHTGRVIMSVRGAELAVRFIAGSLPRFPGVSSAA